ncbi:Tetracycline repressor protein class B from transposon Tn10 [Arthrobacter sp. Bi83]|uniref:TetR/AcrR family transcriptional regulator n=1 Tax=Arthrobacter sp. Bi83 TaxID=2822353 RepID=UPI001DF16472|nr:TetR/AcrR family transcriptional regulator [Arthrobacter sp. Bi83]CAH0219831.1 Tetracycline repressor protein class B from transposon Tn10 [Arthrobacter sp. Bi83]
MPARTNESRPRLSRALVLRAAVAIADAGGIGSLTMRSLANALEAKPMSIYHHVANKDEVLDGIVDIVFSEIELPTVGGDWQSEMRRRAASAREAMRRHPWAIGLVETRTSPGPATLKHHDAVIGTLREAGFSVEMTAHAFALMDAYVYGFALSEATLPINGPETVTEVAEQMMDRYSAEDYPHLAEFSIEHIMKPGYDYGAEFNFGLDLVLEGLARSLQHAGGARHT